MWPFLDNFFLLSVQVALKKTKKTPVVLQIDFLREALAIQGHSLVVSLLPGTPLPWQSDSA